MSRKLIALAVLALGACSPSETFRYRVTVEVNTPQGIKTGSSVWETRITEGSGIPDSGLRLSERGSAVAVDLPTGTLYALMKGQDFIEHQNGNYVSDVLPAHLSKYGQPGVEVVHGDWRANARGIQRAKPNFEMYPDEYPMLVRFTDEKQPATVQKVDPADLAASFGPGISLKRITVTYTSDRPDVHALDERLPWIPTTASLHLTEGILRSQRPFASFIIGTDFEKGR